MIEQQHRLMSRNRIERHRIVTLIQWDAPAVWRESWLCHSRCRVLLRSCGLLCMVHAGQELLMAPNHLGVIGTCRRAYFNVASTAVRYKLTCCRDLNLDDSESSPGLAHWLALEVSMPTHASLQVDIAHPKDSGEQLPGYGDPFGSSYATNIPSSTCTWLFTQSNSHIVAETCSSDEYKQGEDQATTSPYNRLWAVPAWFARQSPPYSRLLVRRAEAVDFSPDSAVAQTLIHHNKNWLFAPKHPLLAPRLAHLALPLFLDALAINWRGSTNRSRPVPVRRCSLVLLPDFGSAACWPHAICRPTTQALGMDQSLPTKARSATMPVSLRKITH